MTLDTATAVAAGSGCLPSAVEDVGRRLLQAFGDREPSPEAINTHMATLKEQAHHLWPSAPVQAAGSVPAGMVPEVWAKMTPSARLGWWYEHHPEAPVDRRPTDRAWTAEELKTVQGKTVLERLTAGHAGPPKG